MQTSYNPEMPRALVGQIADLSNKTVDSFAAEEALNPGVPVMRGTVPDKQVLAVDAEGDAAKAIGVVIHEHKEPTGANEKYYPQGYAVGVMTKGRIWVQTGGAVTAGAAANYKVADGTFVADAVASGIEALACGAKFITSTSAAGLAIVEIG